MTELEEIIQISLTVYKIAITVQINDKIVMLHPKAMQSVDLNDVAATLINSSLTDEEKIQVLEVIDATRNSAFPDNNAGTKT